MEYQVTQSYNGVEITGEQAHEIRLMNENMKRILQDALSDLTEKTDSE